MKLPATGESSSSVAPISSGRVAEAAHRRVAEDRFDARSCRGSCGSARPGKKPGQRQLTRTPVRREFAGDVLRQVQHGRLRRGVDEHARQRPVARHAADVEDRAAAGVDHVLAEDLAAEVRGEQVRVDDAVELFVGDVEIRRRRIDAGAVDQRVDAAVLLDDCRRAAPSPTRGRRRRPRQTSPCRRASRSPRRARCRVRRCGRRRRPWRRPGPGLRTARRPARRCRRSRRRRWPSKPNSFCR